MNENKYVAPELEIIEFDTEDVITTSSVSDTYEGEGYNPYP